MLGTLKVYYKKTLATNCVANGSQCMPNALPAAPSRAGKVFAGWNTQPDGEAFTADTVVTDDVTVYAKWVDPSEPALAVADKTVAKGDADFTLADAIVSATDNKGSDLRDRVEIVDDGGFDVNVPGAYTVTYRLSILSESATAQATITVVEPEESAVTPQDPDSQGVEPNAAIKKRAKSVQTGDELALGGFVLAAVLTGAVAGVASRRRVGADAAR